MTDVTADLALRMLAGFLLGSIPFAVVSMWGSGIDIRKVGSGNPGFNNVLRVSKSRAIICLIGDLGKGVLAILLLHRATDPVSIAWLIGFAVMLGHCYTPWLGFNGGKGIATSAGVMLMLYPAVAALCVVSYVVLRVIGKKRRWREEGAIASLTSVAAFVGVVLLREGVPLGFLAFLLFAIVTWRHKDNLRRLRAGAGTG